MALLDSEKVQLRRLMWYGMKGNQFTQALGYRWATAYGLMEFRMYNMTPQEEDEIRTLLAQTLTCEQNILNVSQDMDTAAAGPWKRNPKQLAENRSLFTEWRFKLLAFFALEPGPEYGRKTRSTAIRV